MLTRLGPAPPRQTGIKLGLCRAISPLPVVTSVCFVSALMSGSMTTRAQEALRLSVTSENAAEKQKQANQPGYYNLQAGPVELRVQAELGTEFNDNVNYANVHPQKDVSFSPGATVEALWPISDLNSLTFSTGIGYVKYIKTTSLDHLYITPDSTLMFRMYVDDFLINFHDNFSIIQDVIQTPTLSGSGSYGQIRNTVGVDGAWDLNKLILDVGYDHDTVFSTSSALTLNDHSSELFHAHASFIIDPTDRAGLEVGGGLTTFDQNVLNNNTHFSAGPFYQAQLSDYLSVKASGGIVFYWFDPSGDTNSLPNDITAYYADLTVTHRMNLWLDETLTAGRELDAGITADILDLYYVRYQANWHVIRDTTLQTHLGYENGTTSGGALETLNRYNAGFGLGYNLTEKLSATMTYDFWIKRSDISALNYIQNRLVFDFRYSF